MRKFFFVLLFVSLGLWPVGCKRQSRRSSTNANSSSQTVAASNQPANGDTVDQPPAVDVENSGDARALFDKGNELYRNDHDREAVEVFKKVVDMEPDFAEAHLKLGLAYAALGQQDEAKESYQKAADAYKKLVKREPKNADAQFNMGMAYYKLGKPDEAVKAYKQAVKLQPDDGDIHYELGLAEMKLAQYQEAVNDLQKAIDLDPDNFRATEALDKAKDGLKRMQEAQKRFDEQMKKQGGGVKSRNQNGNTNSNSNSNSTPSTPATTPKPTIKDREVG